MHRDGVFQAEDGQNQGKMDGFSGVDRPGDARVPLGEPLGLAPGFAPPEKQLGLR